MFSGDMSDLSVRDVNLRCVDLSEHLGTITVNTFQNQSSAR